MELIHIAAHEGRLSAFLREEMRLSAGLVNRLKWTGAITVNGISRHTDYHVLPGDTIVVLLDDEPVRYPAQDGSLTVLYEDAHLLAVDKPAGMLIHPSRSRNRDTLANFVAGYYERTGEKCAFHPVTRLDRDTFGVVLLAKNAHIHALMNELHAAGALEKTYHALVFGGPGEDGGVIDAPIQRLPLPSLLRRVSPEGKPSLARFRVLERGRDMTKLALIPVTGRTHQLRVHCAYMGWPVLGDPQYATPESQALSRELGLSYQQLCARSIRFPHPITGETLEILSRSQTESVKK